MGGIYFLGWLSLITFVIGGMVGSSVYFNSVKSNGIDTTSTAFLHSMSQKVAFTINRFISMDGLINAETKIVIAGNGDVLMIESVPSHAIASVKMSDMVGFSEFMDAIKSSIMIQQSIDVFAIEIAKILCEQMNGKN